VYKVSIFMSVFDVHINRVPVSGTVVDQFYTKGSFMNASLDKASSENEQAGMVIEDRHKRRFLVVQIAGLIARRIVTYPVIGDMLERGQRYGLIRFGSRVDVYMPAEAQLQVSLGDRCVGGETVLSRLG
jgi:phosphatidylserine decarboxylase